MNVSFFLLLLTLAALAFLTSWNKHVLLLLGVTALLWASMLWLEGGLLTTRTFVDTQVRNGVDEGADETGQHAVDGRLDARRLKYATVGNEEGPMIT